MEKPSGGEEALRPHGGEPGNPDTWPSRAIPTTFSLLSPPSRGTHLWMKKSWTSSSGRRHMDPRWSVPTVTCQNSWITEFWSNKTLTVLNHYVLGCFICGIDNQAIYPWGIEPGGPMSPAMVSSFCDFSSLSALCGFQEAQKRGSPALFTSTGTASLAPEPPWSSRDPRKRPHPRTAPIPYMQTGRRGVWDSSGETGVELREEQSPPPFPVDIWKGQNWKEGKCYSSLLPGKEVAYTQCSVCFQFSKGTGALGTWWLQDDRVAAGGLGILPPRLLGAGVWQNCPPYPSSAPVPGWIQWSQPQGMPPVCTVCPNFWD